MLLVLLGALGINQFASQSDSGTSSTASGVAATRSSPASGATTQGPLEPIVLPTPVGTTPRVRPLQTQWIISSEVLDNPEVAAALTDELEAAAGYVERHGIVGDGIGVGRAKPGRLSTMTDQQSRTMTAPRNLVAISPSVASEAINQMAAYPDDDRAVVVLTHNPNPWLLQLPLSGPPDLSVDPAARGSSLRGFVIDVSRGGQPHLDPPPLGSPNTLSADPFQRGNVAEALSRSWVASYDGGWPTP